MNIHQFQTFSKNRITYCMWQLGVNMALKNEGFRSSLISEVTTECEADFHILNTQPAIFPYQISES